MAMAAPDNLIALRYAVPRWTAAWAVPEVPVPESEVHDQAIEYLRALLRAWAERCGRSVRVLRNIGIRWVEAEPRAGFDPDLCLLDPGPAHPEGLNSLRLWEPDIEVPRLAIEVVSPGHPYKDYVDTPERAAASGIAELWIYDPLLAGPSKHGGPHLLQVWSAGEGGYERVHAGSGPGWSAQLSAWLHPCASRNPGEAQLRISDDATGSQCWPTLEQQHRQQLEQQHRQQLEQHRRAEEQRADAAERELAELRRRLQGGD